MAFIILKSTAYTKNELTVGYIQGLLFWMRFRMGPGPCYAAIRDRQS